MITISIIIPVYKVEKYLNQCVDSCLSQSYTDFEIILVDDGSPDASGEICDGYLEQDSRIRVIHQENQGLSGARNKGLSFARGEFILFLDSDDFLASNAILYLLQAQQKTDADIVIGNYYYTYNSNDVKANVEWADYQEYSCESAIEALSENRLQNFAWGKLIRKSIADKVFFPEGKIFEDSFWSYQIINQCRFIVSIATPVIHYRQRGGSISFSYDANRMDVLEGWNCQLEFLRDNYPQIVQKRKDALCDTVIELGWLIIRRMKSKASSFKKLQGFACKNDLYHSTSLYKNKLLKSLKNGPVLFAILYIKYRLFGVRIQ